MFLFTHAPPRDLHSFPTRRSSDLHQAHVAAAPRPLRDDLRTAVAAAVIDDDDLVVGEAELGDDLLDQAEDRKSTRLNSSHITISYAVFCLKKNINGASNQLS